MISHDERLDYYLMVTRLMAEAESQLDVDAMDRASHPYAEDLAALREAIQSAEHAAARIVLALVQNRRSRSELEAQAASPPARH